MNSEQKHILVTGGAGYIGSMLCGELLRRGYRVTAVDALLFGGDSIMPYLPDQNFQFVHMNIVEDDISPHLAGVDGVVHLAAIVGFPACQAVGDAVARKYNVEAVERVFDAAENAGARRFVFSSTYSNYGLAKDDQLVTETSPLNPQSLYAETKIEAEQFLLGQTGTTCVPVVYRFATLFGVSPRTRFDLIVNQFVLEALTQRKLIIYQRGYARAFVHVSDIVQAILIALEADKAIVGREIFNVGHESGNYTKDEIVALVQNYVQGTVVEYKDLSFGGDMRDIRVSFEKIQKQLGFKPRVSVEDGVIEVRDAIQTGLIRNPLDERYRNAQFIVQ